MADKDDKTKVEAEVEETEQVEAPEADESKQEVEQPETPEAEAEDQQEQEESAESEEQAEKSEAEEKPMSRREGLRIQQLLDKLKQKDTQPDAPKDGKIDYRKIIETTPEAYEQLDKASQDLAEKQYRAGLEQAKSIQFQTRLEIDAPKVASKYKQFDTESPEFDPAVANAVNQWYLNSVGYDHQAGTVQNANVRYAEFVEGFMELVEAAAGRRTTKTAQNIAKQAATTGLRPDGSTPKSRLDLTKMPGQMSDEELKAAISLTMPKANS